MKSNVQDLKNVQQKPSAEHVSELKKNKGSSLQPPLSTSKNISQRKVIQAKCGDDSAGGEKMNEAFSNIQSRNSGKEHPLSLQRKVF